MPARRERGPDEVSSAILVQFFPLACRVLASLLSLLPFLSLQDDEVYLNLVLEFIPDTLYKVTRHYNSLRQAPPMMVVKLYVYQMCRSLAHLHALGICHRDIKPQNLLVDSRSHILKLCDFGSSKALVAGEPSVAYICSRYYRAPELIFGATDYTCAIDMWSAGCVFAELLLGHPMFPGETGVDQLVEIIKILGTPTKEQVIAMNRSYTEFSFPIVKPYSWQKVSSNSSRSWSSGRSKSTSK